MIIKIILMITLLSQVFKTNGQGNYTDFHHIGLCITWKPGFAQKFSGVKDGVKTDTKFIIHGLWAETILQREYVDTRKNVPQHETLKEEMLIPIENDLHNHWESISWNKSDFNHWNDQWEKHGKVMVDVVKSIKGPKDYFTETLRLYKAAPLLQWIRDSPNVRYSQKIFDYVQFKQAIYDGFRKKCRLFCGSVNFTHSYLYQVILCYDFDLVEIDCPVLRDFCHNFIVL